MSRPSSRSLALPVVALLLAACSSSPQAAPRTSPAPAPSPQAATPAPAPAPAPAPVPAPTPSTPTSAAGIYDFSTTVQGTTVTGVATVAMENGRPSGTIATSATPEVAIKNATVEGQKVTVVADSPDGEIVLEFNMNGQDFTGTWWYGGQSGSLTGRKR